MHARAGGYVIRAGVHFYMYICVYITPKKFERHFSGQLTFSNTCSDFSSNVYRLALPLGAPETLSSFSKSRISLFNVHLALFV